MRRARSHQGEKGNQDLTCERSSDTLLVGLRPRESAWLFTSCSEADAHPRPNNQLVVNETDSAWETDSEWEDDPVHLDSSTTGQGSNWRKVLSVGVLLLLFLALMVVLPMLNMGEADTSSTRPADSQTWAILCGYLAPQGALSPLSPLYA